MTSGFSRLSDMSDEDRNAAVLVYSDGSSSGRDSQPGGWGFVVVIEGLPVAAGAGGDRRTTNNVMEMRGAINGLVAVMRRGLHKLGKPVVLVSDSQYVLGIGSGKYTPSKNLEDAAKLRALVKRLDADTRWIRGHSGERWNERCDKLANYGKEQNGGPRKKRGRG